MSFKVNITEVGLRDGLQNVDHIVKTSDKLHIINGLIDAGIKRIQVASFVHPGLVPQMEDAESLIRQLPNNNNVEFSGFVLNHKGLERAIQSGLKKIETSISTSETYSLKNTSMSLTQATRSLKNIIKTAKENGLTIRAGLQCVWGCVYEGVPDPKYILSKVSEIVEMGVDNISLSDSTGMANPYTISNQLELIMNKFPDILISLHLHDTGGNGLVNLEEGLKLGLNQFDCAFGGIGGSPFIKGSTGNVATEETIYMLDARGFYTGIDIEKVAKISRWLENKIDKSYFGGKLYKQITVENIST
tara:strand:- start:4830 stop:5738 length:909 start_codon:yes stop_codon:yes gene_type:complete